MIPLDVGVKCKTVLLKRTPYFTEPSNLYRVLCEEKFIGVTSNPKQEILHLVVTKPLQLFHLDE